MEQLEHSLEFTLDEQTTISPLRTIEGTTEGTSPANTDQTLEKTSEKWEGSGQETGLSDVFDEIDFSDETTTSQSTTVNKSTEFENITYHELSTFAGTETVKSVFYSTTVPSSTTSADFASTLAISGHTTDGKQTTSFHENTSINTLPIASNIDEIAETTNEITTDSTTTNLLNNFLTISIDEIDDPATSGSVLETTQELESLPQFTTTNKQSSDVAFIDIITSSQFSTIQSSSPITQTILNSESSTNIHTTTPETSTILVDATNSLLLPTTLESTSLPSTIVHFSAEFT